MTAIRNKQRGAALVIGLILLVVITLLAVVGMNIANTELASATSEQLRLRAFNAAETGLEATMQTLADVADTDPDTHRRRRRGSREFAAEYRDGRRGGHLQHRHDRIAVKAT